MADGALVSVIIAAFNSEAYLEDALVSVFEQQWNPLEVIVVDDGSTDGTAAVAGRFGSRLTVVTGADEGLAATRNRGVAAARGACLLHLDADDLLAPNAIRTLMATLERTACDIAAGRFCAFASPELPGDVAARFTVPREPQRGHLAGVAMIRAEVFDRVGPLDERYHPASDMQWWQRAREQDVAIALIDDLVLHRRIHGHNSSLRDSASHQRAALKVARDALRRKRAQ